MYILTFIAIFIGSVVQATAGFAGGTIGTMILSATTTILAASTLSTAASCTVSFLMVCKFRKYLNIKLVIFPVFIYTVSFYLFLQHAMRIDPGMLKAYFGLALIALGIYSMCFSDKIKLQGGYISGGICAALSGILSAYFGIGGPPMALYMLAISNNDKNVYIANVQCHFAISGMIATIIRIHSGLLMPDFYQMIAVAFAAILIGRYVGSRILDKIDIATLKQVIYFVLIICGSITFFNQII